MDDRRWLVEEPFSEVKRGTRVAAAAKLLRRVDAMGHFGSRLVGRPWRAGALPGALDRRCYEPELGPFRETRWNARKHGCAVGVRREVWANGGHLYGPGFHVRGGAASGRDGAAATPSGSLDANWTRAAGARNRLDSGVLTPSERARGAELRNGSRSAGEVSEVGQGNHHERGQRVFGEGVLA